jgi:hypothetical protein
LRRGGRALNDEPISRVHTNQNAVSSSQIDRRLRVGDAARHHANLLGSEAEALPGAIEIRPAAGLNEQLRGGMKEGTGSTLIKPDLLCDTNLQPSRPQGSKDLFEIAGDRQHMSDFYY